MLSDIFLDKIVRHIKVFIFDLQKKFKFSKVIIFISNFEDKVNEVNVPFKSYQNILLRKIQE